MYQLSNSQNLRLKRDLPQIYAYSSKIAFSQFPGMTLVKIPQMLVCKNTIKESRAVGPPTFVN